MTSRKPGTRLKAKRKKLSPLGEVERETKNILRLKVEIARTFWDLGKSLDRVNENELYLAAGCRSFEGYLRKEVKIGRSNAYRLIEMSRKFTKATALRHGQEKLMGMIEYAKATPEDDRPIDVARYEIEVRSPSGKITTKPFKEATANELKRGASRLRRREKRLLSEATVQISPGAAKKTRESMSLFLSNANQLLRKMQPRPCLEMSAVEQGADPTVSLKLSNLALSRLAEVFALLAQAAVLGIVSEAVGETLKTLKE